MTAFLSHMDLAHLTCHQESGNQRSPRDFCENIISIVIFVGGRSICGELGFVQPSIQGGGSDDPTVPVSGKTDWDF